MPPICETRSGPGKAAEPARLKVTYQSWTIRPIEPGTGYTAQRRDRRGGLRSVYAPTLPELEARLAASRPAGRRAAP
jgi:hypothetical protein